MPRCSAVEILRLYCVSVAYSHFVGMDYFIHKGILIKSYFCRKLIQVWKHVSDSDSADFIMPCTKTSLDSIT